MFLIRGVQCNATQKMLENKKSIKYKVEQKRIKQYKNAYCLQQPLHSISCSINTPSRPQSTYQKIFAGFVHKNGYAFSTCFAEKIRCLDNNI